jgi:hypothetical protein
LIYRKGDSMRGQIQLAVFAVCIATLAAYSMPMAEAKAQIRQCSVSPSKTQGHWSWRLIDGRKCWYAGKTVIAKSSLRWLAAAPSQANAAQVRAVEAKAVEAKAVEAKAVEAKAVDVRAVDVNKAGNLTPADVEAAQARPAPTTVGVVTEKRGNPMDAQARMLDDDSFESRWRARVSTE